MQYHIPVMLKETIEILDPKPHTIYVDATIGTGGHSEAILERGARVIGIDMDKEALDIARDRLARFGDRMSYVHANFSDLDEVLERFKITAISGIIYDLGTSLIQLKNPQRGFSLYENGPLDMRMDLEGPITCHNLINNLPEDQLREIIWRYGEDRRAKRIARYIVEERNLRGSIETTGDLASIVTKATSKRYRKRRNGLHPATRTFQALRIVVNDELKNFKDSLKIAITYLEPRGRIVTTSFHSLEDRIVKHTFLEWSRGDPPLVKILTKKPHIPTKAEIEENPRSRSAKLRAAERVPLG